MANGPNGAPGTSVARLAAVVSNLELACAMAPSSEDLIVLVN